jgi:hypothetical protein
MTIPKRTVSFPNDETGTDWRLVTAEELAALEARKPQVDAEVLERARRWAQQLRLWPRRATPTEDGLRLIPEDCLRRCSAAFDALLAAVEAAPEGEPPRVLRWEGYAEPGPDEGRDVIVRIHCDSIAARRFCGTGKIVHVESAVEASAPTPDFASMTPEDLSLEDVQSLRDWLDERGMRSTWYSIEFDWSARLCNDSGEEITRTVDHFDETEALLELCRKVARLEEENGKA